MASRNEGKRRCSDEECQQAHKKKKGPTPLPKVPSPSWRHDPAGAAEHKWGAITAHLPIDLTDLVRHELDATKPGDVPPLFFPPQQWAMDWLMEGDHKDRLKILALPPGTGKTVVAAGVLLRTLHRDHQNQPDARSHAVAFVTRGHLARQAARELSRWARRLMGDHAARSDASEFLIPSSPGAVPGELSPDVRTAVAGNTKKGAVAGSLGWLQAERDHGGVHVISADVLRGEAGPRFVDAMGYGCVIVDEAHTCPSLVQGLRKAVPSLLVCMTASGILRDGKIACTDAHFAWTLPCLRMPRDRTATAFFYLTPEVREGLCMTRVASASRCPFPPDQTLPLYWKHLLQHEARSMLTKIALLRSDRGCSRWKLDTVYDACRVAVACGCLAAAACYKLGGAQPATTARCCVSACCGRWTLNPELVQGMEALRDSLGDHEQEALRDSLGDHAQETRQMQLLMDDLVRCHSRRTPAGGAEPPAVLGLPQACDAILRHLPELRPILREVASMASLREMREIDSYRDDNRDEKQQVSNRHPLCLRRSLLTLHRRSIEAWAALTPLEAGAAVAEACCRARSASGALSVLVVTHNGKQAEAIAKQVRSREGLEARVVHSGQGQARCKVLGRALAEWPDQAMALATLSRLTGRSGLPAISAVLARGLVSKTVLAFLFSTVVIVADASLQLGYNLQNHFDAMVFQDIPRSREAYEQQIGRLCRIDVGRRMRPVNTILAHRGGTLDHLQAVVELGFSECGPTAL